MKILKLLAHDRCAEVRKNVIDVFVRAVEDVKEKKEEEQNKLWEYMDDIVDILVKSTHD